MFGFPRSAGASAPSDGNPPDSVGSGDGWDTDVCLSERVTLGGGKNERLLDLKPLGAAVGKPDDSAVDVCL